MYGQSHNIARLHRLGCVLLLVVSCCCCRLGDVVTAFTSPCTRSVLLRDDSCHMKVFVPTSKVRTSRLYWGFFRRDNNSDQIEEPKVVDDDTTSVGTNTVETVKSVEPPSQEKKIAVTVAAPPKILTPEEEAIRLRSEAAKSRLEAERMDAELTLRKIEKLEKALKKQQLEVAMMNDSNMTATVAASSLKKTPEDIQREIDALLKKVRGETPTPTYSPSTTTAISSSSDPAVAVTDTVEPIWPNYVMPYDEEECQRCYDSLKGFPQFLLGNMALQLEMELEIDEATKKTKPIDNKKLATRIDEIRRQDFSFSKKKRPTFSRQQLDEVQKEVESLMASNDVTEAGNKSQMNWWGGDDGRVIRAMFNADDVTMMIQSIKNDERYQPLWDSKDSKSIAQLVLEYQYYTTTLEADMEKNKEQIVALVAEDEWLKPFISASNISGTNAIIESLYPQCTTKKDIVFDMNSNNPSPIPTEAAVKKLIADILPKANFQASSKPEPVLGGYIVRGQTKLSGDAFIEQLDKVMDQSNLKNQMNVFYVNDFTVLVEEVDFDSPGSTTTMFPDEAPPVLYVTSANICREPLPIRLSIVSAFGLATSWYFSVYPFLLNPSIATRVDEQLAIADANMVPDLTWLSDLSIPLFATFMSIQLSHELGHLIVAGANGIKTSPPTFVPSLFTGLTSTVTTFRTPPKNAATMFDYAAAGPIAGIITSILAIAVGCQITSVTSDMSLFPSLPLEILRQSTLGGGVIEFVLGNGALSLPKAAIGTAAVAGMTVPLHPIAIAGFIGLIINALAVLPIGSKS